MALSRLLSLAWLALAVGAVAGAAAPPGPLGDLAAPRHGRPRHDGTWDRLGGNVDFRGLQAGQSLTLFETRGAGIVRRFWMTFFPRAPALHRQLVLRMYWDGEATPSVEVPVGDFFGVGFGERRDYASLPLAETSGGYDCYWPMPFHRSARWTLANVSATDALVWANVDFTAYQRLPPELRHFHAQWRRENPTTAGRAYTILEAAGRGHFVGAALFMQNRRPGAQTFFGPFGFLEGDEMIFVDGETTPSIVGTGTEDYFGGGFYFESGPIVAPYHGVLIKDEALARVSAYRWHVEDAMPFARAIRVTIEHGSQNDYEGDYSSVAFFYQTEPHAPFPPLPSDPAQLLPLGAAGP